MITEIFEETVTGGTKEEEAEIAKEKIATNGTTDSTN